MNRFLVSSLVAVTSGTVALADAQSWSRSSDGLRLYVEVHRFETREEALKAAQNAKRSAFADEVEGTYTGRKLGDRAWHDRIERDGTALGSAKLVSLRGTDVLIVKLMRSGIVESQSVKPRTLPRKDILSMEEIAVSALRSFDASLERPKR